MSNALSEERPAEGVERVKAAFGNNGVSIRSMFVIWNIVECVLNKNYYILVSTSLPAYLYIFQEWIMIVNISNGKRNYGFGI